MKYPDFNQQHNHNSDHGATNRKTQTTPTMLPKPTITTITITKTTIQPKPTRTLTTTHIRMIKFGNKKATRSLNYIEKHDWTTKCRRQIDNSENVLTLYNNSKIAALIETPNT